MAPSDPDWPRRARVALLLAAACSGAATLVYELSWVRVLSLPLGSAFPALSVVVAAFLGGLGLGALLGGRLADRVARPARAYAAVEVAVAGVAALIPLFAPALGHLDMPGLGGRAALAGLAMLLPTALMGATFPLLSAALHDGDAEAGHVPGLYAVNTAGATLGALLAGFWLPYAWGVPGTLGLAAALNLAAALLSFGAPARSPSRPRTSAPPASHSSFSHLWLGLALGSGLLMALAQVLWDRSLVSLKRGAFTAFSLDPSEALALVLVLLLGGNVLGAWIAHRWRGLDGRALARRLALVWLAGGIGLFLGIEGVVVAALDLLAPSRATWRLLALPVQAAPILGTSVVLGVAFPLLARVHAGALAGHGARMGRIWGVNTAGAVLGALLGGWWLLPAVGVGRGLLGCALLALALAALCWRLGRGPAWGLLAPAVLGLGAGGALFGLPLDPGQAWFAWRDVGRIVASWEGREATTLVVEDGEGARGMVSNGHEIWPSDGYPQLGFGVLRLHPDPREVLLVGFGTGALARGMLVAPSLERLTIVEIDGDQYGAAALFGQEAVLADGRVEALVDDALHFLTTTDRRFDVIAVDAWGPEVSPGPFTREFHALALAHLAEDGLVWAKLSPLSPASRRAPVDAVRCTYPRATLRAGVPEALVGAQHPLPGETALPSPAAEPCAPLRFLYPVHFARRDERPRGGEASRRRGR